MRLRLSCEIHRLIQRADDPDATIVQELLKHSEDPPARSHLSAGRMEHAEFINEKMANALC